MRNYYAELRQAEKLGKANVRNLVYVFLDEIKEEKDTNELDRLLDAITCLTVIAGSKELCKMYGELAYELLSWVGENANELLSWVGENANEFKGE